MGECFKNLKKIKIKIKIKEEEEEEEENSPSGLTIRVHKKQLKKQKLNLFHLFLFGGCTSIMVLN